MLLNSGIWCHAEEGGTCSASVAPCQAASMRPRWGKETGKRASGASPATWLNLSLCVSPGSVRAMRKQGRLYWVTDTLDSPQIRHKVQKGWRKRMHVSMFSRGGKTHTRAAVQRCFCTFVLPTCSSLSYTRAKCTATACESSYYMVVRVLNRTSMLLWQHCAVADVKKSKW